MYNEEKMHKVFFYLLSCMGMVINVGNLFFRKIPPIRNKGIYRIDKLIHTGDTHDNPWSTQINARVF